jgi:hypothetical protein
VTGAPGFGTAAKLFGTATKVSFHRKTAYYLAMDSARAAVFLLLVLTASLPGLFAQLADARQDFSAPVQWGPGSLQMQWGAKPELLRMKGDEGMPDKSGEHFAVMNVDDWITSGDEPYSRSIVSRVVWPLGTISAKDAGKTVKFSALFGWFGGEPMRVQDLFISGHSGFVAGDQLLQGLEGLQDFQFESVGEKKWGEVSVSYTFKPEDAGKELKFLLQIQSKSELSGFPNLATSDWKITVSD